MKMQTLLLNAISFKNVKIDDLFWNSKIETHRDRTIKVCIKRCEETGRVSNFAKAGGLIKGGFEGIYYNDSDVYKVIEGIAYTLMHMGNPELEAKADEIIEMIAAAQQDDGYINTYFTLCEPHKKWIDMGMHEDYCGGHLIEAAVAYIEATGKKKLLEVACKLADHYDNIFGPGKKHWVTGHEEVELALVKLYRLTGEERYLKLAYWFLEERGHGNGAGRIWEKEEWGPEYCQDDKPVREMSRVTGHAVRAMYLYSGMADVAARTGDHEYIKALERLWDNVVLHNMYITGGIGPSKRNEGFTSEYDLPNKEAYCETCASIGMVLWNHRMNLLYGDGKYADVVERCIYNGVLSGVSLDGSKFFYENPLASDGSHHRREWYDCSCCPTQLARFIPSIGDYIYNNSDAGIWINMYIASCSEIQTGKGKVVITQVTDYPWDGKIKISVQSDIAEEFDVHLRYPSWCRSAKIYVNGKAAKNLLIEKGYIKLSRKWEMKDSIYLELDMPVEKVYSNPAVLANQGRVALQRGPLVYCFENTDNVDYFSDISITKEAEFIVEYHPELLGGIVAVKVFEPGADRIYTAIPYYSWDNRDAGGMAVWVPEKDKCEKECLYLNHAF